MIGIIVGIIIIAITIVPIVIITNKKETTHIDDDNEYPEFETKVIDAKFDWSNLNFNINSIEYNYPWEISEFINNGWNCESKDDEIKLEEIINIDYLKSIFPEYTDDYYDYLGYDSINLKQKNMNISLYYDLKNFNSKIVDSNISSIIIKSTDKNIDDFYFYGLKFS